MALVPGSARRGAGEPVLSKCFWQAFYPGDHSVCSAVVLLPPPQLGLQDEQMGIMFVKWPWPMTHTDMFKTQLYYN